MAFLAGLGALGTGYQQGQDHAQQIRSRAQQIQEAQMALDTHKKQLQADAAAFSGAFSQPQGVPGGGQPPIQFPGPQMQPPPGPPPTAQPMQPGQASQPAVPPQMPASSPPPPSGGAVTAPSAAPPSAAAGGGSFQGQGQIDPTDPRAAVQTVMSIAAEIKQRNPGIDPQTLMLATSRIIDMSKGLAPALRQGAQVVIQDMKDQVSRANTGDRVSAQRDIADQNIQSREGIAEQRSADTRRGQDMGLQRAREMAGAAMQRTQASLQAANQRAAQGVWSKEKLAAYTERAKAAQLKLTTAQKQLSSLQSALVPGDDPRAAKAQKDIEAATNELDRVNKAAGLDAGAAAPAAQGPAASGAAKPQRGPAPATLKGKPIWPEGGKWVYEDGTEAK